MSTISKPGESILASAPSALCLIYHANTERLREPDFERPSGLPAATLNDAALLESIVSSRRNQRLRGQNSREAIWE